MNGSFILRGAFALLPFFAFAAPSKEGAPLQALKLQYDDLCLSQKHQKVELDLLSERINSLLDEISELKSESSISSKASKEVGKESTQLLDKRISSLEKNTELLQLELKALSKEMDRVAKLQEDKFSQFNSDIKSLKQSIQTAIAILKPEETGSEKYYVVKPGDSLGKIALEQKVDIKSLRSLNNLSSDRINIGQKLKLS